MHSGRSIAGYLDAHGPCSSEGVPPLAANEVQSLSLGCGTTRIVKYDVVGLDMGEVSMLSVVAKSIGTIGY